MISILNAALARFFNGQIWTYKGTVPSDGSVVMSGTYNTNVPDNNGVSFYTGKVTGPGIDCSHFVEQAELAAGFNVPYETTAAMATIIHSYNENPNEIDPYYNVVALNAAQVGDLVVFVGHVGIISSYSYDSTTKIATGTFIGAQSSATGLATGVNFSTDPTSLYYFGGTNNGKHNGPLFVGIIAPNVSTNDSTYNSAAAAAHLNLINDNVDNGIALYNQAHRRDNRVRPCLLPPPGVGCPHDPAAAYRIPRRRLSRHLAW